MLLAYEQLTLEGYFVTRRGAGTFVSPELPPPAPTPATALRAAIAEPLSARGRRLVQLADDARSIALRTDVCAIDFMYGACEPDPAVIAPYRRALAVALEAIPSATPPPPATRR